MKLWELVEDYLVLSAKCTGSRPSADFRCTFSYGPLYDAVHLCLGTCRVTVAVLHPTVIAQNATSRLHPTQEGCGCRPRVGSLVI